MKDPAALLYIDKWLMATIEMKADARAYYMDMILFQYDKGSLPNNMEELANICRVRISEYNNFKQVFEQVLKHKFEQNETGRLENEFAKEIIQKRKLFQEKRKNAGKLSYIIRYAISEFKATKKDIRIIKNNICIENIDTKNEQVLKQVIEQIYELYINEDEDEDIIKDEDKNKEYHEFIILFNSISKRNFKGCDKSRRQFNARIKKGFKIENFEKAIKNLYKDSFHKEKNFQYATPEFITRSDKLEQFLNAKPIFNSKNVNDPWDE